MGEFGMAGLVYFVASLTLHGGGPPFYRRSDGKDAMSEGAVKNFVLMVFPYLIVIFLSFMALWITDDLRIYLAVGLAGFAGGIRVRRDLSKITNGPEPWVTNIWIGKWPIWTTRWPMLIFDIWTIGFCLILGVLT